MVFTHTGTLYETGYFILDFTTDNTVRLVSPLKVVGKRYKGNIIFTEQT